MNLSLLCKKVLVGLVVWPVALFFSIPVVFATLIGFLRSPSRFNRSKDHSKRYAELLQTSNIKELGEHKFVTVPDYDGNGKKIKLHYVTKGEGRKKLMLFLHGFPEFWYSWRKLIHHFASSPSQQYQTVALDMRGYGDSDRPGEVGAYTRRHLVSDVKEVIKALGFKQCTLVAHDWGGTVAWSFASEYPEMLDNLIIMNAPNDRGFSKHLKQGHYSQLLKSWYIFFFQLPWLPEFVYSRGDYNVVPAMYKGAKFGLKNQQNITDDDIAMFKWAISRPGALRAMINYYRNLVFSDDALLRTGFGAKRICVRTLILWGKDDGALEPGIAECSASYCDNCEVRFIDNCSHWTPCDQPEAVIGHMQSFLSSN
eukprot:Nk52_evm45s2496 gene=Nk52_evmTU45s2496